MAASSISGKVRSWRGEKHSTRAVPGTASARSSWAGPGTGGGAGGVSGSTAAKSLVKTNVAV